MVENITQTANGYRATINGLEWTFPNGSTDPLARMVQEAIAAGASVMVEEAPSAPIPNLTFAQLLIGLVSEGWITEAEGNGWLDGTLPPAVVAVIDTLPANQRFASRARALRPSVVLRVDPLVGALGVAAGKSSAQIDAFFQTYAGV